MRVRLAAAMAALVTTTASLLFSTGASASPRYPDELRAALGLSYLPKCTLCHGEASGSDAGPCDTPFGKSMVARGLRGEAASTSDGGVDADGGIDPTLASALAAMRKDGVDSDVDGAQDLDELSWGGDPNKYDGSSAGDLQTTSYGCALGRASDAVPCSIAGVAVLLIASGLPEKW